MKGLQANHSMDGSIEGTLGDQSLGSGSRAPEAVLIVVSDRGLDQFIFVTSKIIISFESLFVSTLLVT